MRKEKITTLAFSMYANKGAYALLLGSGISRPAHIPSGWEVEIELIKRIGATKGVTVAEDWHQWYQQTYDQPATYCALLEALEKFSTERVQLMAPFFEPTAEERELGWKAPTEAHVAIAKLAKKGYIRVILTTNFDRLLEQALESVGVTPQVISHETGIAQAIPLVHCQSPTIVKINGDYKDCQFRNTSAELDDYPEQMTSYLERIFEDFGLVTCGWSALNDKGLIKIINCAAQSRYNSFFSYIGKPNDCTISLSTNRQGELMPIVDADNLFSELYEQIMALEKHDVNAKMSHTMMMERVKKYLSSELYNIKFAEIIENWGEEAYRQITEVAHYNFHLTREAFNRYLDIHLKTIAPLLDAAILKARWGKEQHIAHFGNIMSKLCTRPINVMSGPIQDTPYLHALAPMLLLNTIGVACVKYNRFKELNSLLSISVPAGNFMGNARYSLLFMLGETRWDKEKWRELVGFSHYNPYSIFMHDQLKPRFKDYFVSESDYENVFYIWEHLKSLIYGYNKCAPIGVYFPLGYFLHKRMEYNMPAMEKEPYTLFFEEADALKNDWEPIKQGMFGGSYDNYKQIYGQADEFYKKSYILLL